MPITEPVYQPDNEFASVWDMAANMLAGSRFVGAPRGLVHALGLNAAIYLSECMYWQSKVGSGNWFGRTIPQMLEETGLSKGEQEGARKILRDKGIIKEMKAAGYRNKTQIDYDQFRVFVQSNSAVQKSAAENQRVENQRLAGQKSAASRPEISGSSNILEHTNNKDISPDSDETAISPDGQSFVAVLDQAVRDTTPASQLSISPYGYYEAYCNGRGIDPAALTGGPLERELHFAKLLKQDGIPARDVHDCAAWLQSQDWWRDKGFNMNAIRTQYSRWVAAGRPQKQKAPGSKHIKGSTPNI